MFLKLSRKISIDRQPAEKTPAEKASAADVCRGMFCSMSGKTECFITAYRFTAEKDCDLIFITAEGMRGVYSDKDMFFAITDNDGRIIYSCSKSDISIDLKHSLKKGEEMSLVSVYFDKCENVPGFDFELLITDRLGNTEEAFITEENLLKNSSWSYVPADRVDILTDYTEKIENNVLSASLCSFADRNGQIDNYIFRSLMLTAAVNKACLRLDKNTYYLTAEPDSPYGIDMSFYKLDGLTLDGNGSTIMMTDNFKGGFCFIGSRNMLIKDLYLDYVNVPWAQGTVVAVDSTAQTVTLQLDGDYNIFDDARFHETITAHFGTVRDRNEPRFLNRDALYYFFMSACKRLGERLYEIKLSQVTPMAGSQINVDDKLVINNRVGCNMSMFDIRESGSFTLSNITVYSCACTGVVGSQMTGPVTVDGFKMIYRPDSDLWITSTADGVHMQAGPAPVTVQNSVFTGLIDDGVNLYQWRALVDSIASKTSFVINTDGGCLPKNGDTLEFYDQEEMKYLGAARVTAVENVTGEGPHRFADITLDTPVEGLRTGDGGRSATYIYIREQDFEGSIIKNNLFSNLRGRGVVLHSAKTKVADNSFINLSNHAVHGWYGYEEGLRLRDLTVEGNYFNRVGYYSIEANSDPAGVISIRLDNNAATEQSKNLFHDTVRILNNTIVDFHGSAINVGNTENVEIAGNRITLNTAEERYGGETGIEVSRCKGVSIRENRLDNALSDTWVPLSVTDSEEIQSSDNVYFKAGALCV